MLSITDFWVALQFLTILPTPSFKTFTSDNEKQALYWYPVVGLVVGALTTGIFYLGHWLFQSLSLSIGLAFLTQTVITGALHTDGLADTADALFSSKKNPVDKLTIMKDSRIGTMGSLALFFYFFLKWLVFTLLPSNIIWRCFLLEPVLGKFFIYIVMKHLPYVSINSKLLSTFTDIIPNWWYRTSLVLIIILPLVLFSPHQSLWISGLTSIGVILFIVWVKGSIGGATGDIYGTTQELVGLLIPFACLLAIKIAI